MASVDTETPTVAELLDQATARLDALAAEFAARDRALAAGWMTTPLDPAVFELWRTVAHLNAAVRLLAEQFAASDPTQKAA